MARARNIKPGFYKNEDLAECSVWARLLFPGLWMLVDREGRMEDRPKRIKGEIFPYDSIEVDPLLQELENWGFIERYVSDGKKVISVISFLDHQSPHGKEADSELPDRDGYYIVHERDKKNGCVTGKYYKHETSTVPAQDKHETSTVPAHPESLILNPESLILNPESLNPESLNPEISEAIASSCTELYSSVPDAREKPIDDSPIFIEMPLSGKSGFHAVTENNITHWITLYPAVNVPQEIKKMVGWLEGNPKKRKTKRGIGAFITSWLARTQDNSQKPICTNKTSAQRPDYQKIYGSGSGTVINSTATEVSRETN